jgi:hypothetical protein
VASKDVQKAPTKTQALKTEPGISLKDAVTEVGELIDKAIDFQRSELEAEWALAERYYNGETDLEEYEGRSNVTKTEVRDAIRNSMPSIMRILLQSRKPVQYIPSSILHAQWIEQQSEYVLSLFYKNNGYRVLYDSILEALKLKIGPMKAFWEPDPRPEFFRYTNVPFSTLEELANDPLIQLENFEKSDTSLGDIELFNVEGVKMFENGRIVIEAVPNAEFFISRNCNSIEQALEMGVHGQRQVITVAKAMDMGIECDDWLELDVEDPELSDNSESASKRRGYIKDPPNSVSSTDLLRHEFLLTEAYVMYDLEGDGRGQIYRFLLGGTTYTYLHHERVSDSPFSIAVPIPIPHTMYGHSIADLTVNEQDTSTSLLRAAIDNAHAANNAKIAADPTKTNFDDIMNTALNAPIRKRAGDTLQVIQIPFTGQGNLAMLQYLDLDVQSKVGVTKAAQGLDPDAMQSTDKNAVMNTIATAQGQTELIVRNIIETGLIRLFRLLLKLSVAHMSPMQMMKTKGKVIPIDTRMFDTDAAAVPGVGLGTASPMQRQGALAMILQKQEEYMEKFGPNNPFTSFAQVYNTLEDILETNGIYNVERYFNIVTPDVEKQWAEAEEKKKQEMAKMQAENAPMDPSKAYLEVEAKKRETEVLRLLSEQEGKERELSFKSLSKAEEIDLQRDKLTQDRVIKLRELSIAKSEDEAIKKEQEGTKKPNLSRGSSDGDKSVSAGTQGGGKKASGE